jgi:hypothetical protein
MRDNLNVAALRRVLLVEHKSIGREAPEVRNHA